NFSSNKPLRGRKYETYEGGIRVPAFMNWPGRLKPAKVSQLMHAVDWLPTLVRLAGASVPADPKWDGMDVWPLIAGQRTDVEPRTFYWVVGDKWLGLRHGDWKIVRAPR